MSETWGCKNWLGIAAPGTAYSTTGTSEGLELRVEEGPYQMTVGFNVCSSDTKRGIAVFIDRKDAVEIAKAILERFKA